MIRCEWGEFWENGLKVLKVTRSFDENVGGCGEEVGRGSEQCGGALGNGSACVDERDSRTDDTLDGISQKGVMRAA